MEISNMIGSNNNLFVGKTSRNLDKVLFGARFHALDSLFAHLLFNPILMLHLFVYLCHFLAIGYRPLGRDQKEAQCACQVTVFDVRTISREARGVAVGRPLYTRGLHVGCAAKLNHV